MLRRCLDYFWVPLRICRLSHVLVSQCLFTYVCCICIYKYICTQIYTELHARNQIYKKKTLQHSHSQELRLRTKEKKLKNSTQLHIQPAFFTTPIRAAHPPRLTRTIATMLGQISIQDNAGTDISTLALPPPLPPSSFDLCSPKTRRQQRRSRRTKRRGSQSFRLANFDGKDDTFLTSPITLTAVVSSLDDSEEQYYTFQFFLDCRH